ncbi:MAG TPA: hypothetical protein VK543_18980 [Puia sp.]|nr:hypothetical protein [Puia sp.]
MKHIALFIMLFSLVMISHSQDSTVEFNRQKEILHSRALVLMEKKDREINYLAFRKYGVGVSGGTYFSVLGSGRNPFGVFDIVFTDRISPFGIAKNASLKATFSFGFEPFQGSIFNLGPEYDLLSKKNRLNLFLGLHYSFGLPQSAVVKDNSSVFLGFNHYLVPCLGLVWWPWKVDLSDSSHIGDYWHPRLKQLFFIKLIVGYSFLLNRPQIEPSAGFDKNLNKIITGNTENTLNIKLCVGINIPSYGFYKDNYLQKSQLRYLFQ